MHACMGNQLLALIDIIVYILHIKHLTNVIVLANTLLSRPTIYSLWNSWRHFVRKIGHAMLVCLFGSSNICPYKKGLLIPYMHNGYTCIVFMDNYTFIH